MKTALVIACFGKPTTSSEKLKTQLHLDLSTTLTSSPSSSYPPWTSARRSPAQLSWSGRCRCARWTALESPLKSLVSPRDQPEKDLVQVGQGSLKLLTIDKRLPTFPHKVRGLNRWPQRWEASVLPPSLHLMLMNGFSSVTQQLIQV